MVYIAQYNEALGVMGFVDENNRSYGLEYQAELESLGTITYKTQEELDVLIVEQLVREKWDDLSVYLSDLTVPISNDRTIDVSPGSLLNIDNEINAMTDQDTSTWYETWGSFEVNKVDLQEARILRKEAKDAKILELGIRGT